MTWNEIQNEIKQGYDPDLLAVRQMFISEE